jgi:D-tyrosyl-tRNA(Tyr) deacylase
VFGKKEIPENGESGACRERGIYHREGEGQSLVNTISDGFYNWPAGEEYDAMRVLLQRVSDASVTIDGAEKSRIGRGILLLLGIEHEDGEEDIEWLVKKLLSLRIFEDEDGKMNLSILDVGGEALVVSQFTLHARVKKGTRPGFDRAARPEVAIPLYEKFVAAFEEGLGKPVGTGEFGAMMKVALTNDGPVTIWIDSRNRE